MLCKAALNRRNPCAEEIAPIVTILREFPHRTVNIGSLIWPNIAIQNIYWRAVGKQHGAMGAHPIRIELIKEKFAAVYEYKQMQICHEPNEYNCQGIHVFQL